MFCCQKCCKDIHINHALQPSTAHPGNEGTSLNYGFHILRYSNRSSPTTVLLLFVTLRYPLPHSQHTYVINLAIYHYIYWNHLSAYPFGEWSCSSYIWVDPFLIRQFLMECWEPVFSYKSHCEAIIRFLRQSCYRKSILNGPKIFSGTWKQTKFPVDQKQLLEKAWMKICHNFVH